MRGIYERRKEWFLNEQSAEDEKEELKAEYHTFDEVISAIVSVSHNIPRKNSGIIHKGKCVRWLKDQGIRIRHSDWSSMIDAIESIYV